MPSPLPPTPRTLPSLPPRKVSAILAAGTLAVGIVLGALIGPAPASSLASGARAAAVARVLGLLALGESTGASGQLLAGGAGQAATGAEHAASSATEASSSGGVRSAGAGKAAAAGAASGARGAGQSETSSATPTSSESTPASGSPSPTKHKSPAAGGGEAGESKPARLAPVAHVWLIVLPYGSGFASLAGQAAAAPYTNTQLVHQGTLLSGYSALQASELAGDAALLSGQVTGGVSTIAPPCAAPCATTEPAGAQAADAFLQAVVPQIVASAEYREGGLIAITFAATQTSAAPAIAYPAGTQVSTSSTAGAPGALLLSPFLARPGARVASAFDELAPRKSLEELLRDPSKTPHR